MDKTILSMIMLSVCAMHASDGSDMDLRRVSIYSANTGRWLVCARCAEWDFVGLKISGTTDLHLAAKHGDIDDVRKLLKQDFIDINVQNDDGDTPLHYAVYHGRADVVRKLLARRANAKICNRAKNTSLHYAALNGNEDITRELLTHGADQEAQNEYGFTPADIAQEQGNDDLAAYIRDFKKQSLNDLD